MHIKEVPLTESLPLMSTESGPLWFEEYVLIFLDKENLFLRTVLNPQVLEVEVVLERHTGVSHKSRGKKGFVSRESHWLL